MNEQSIIYNFNILNNSSNINKIKDDVCLTLQKNNDLTISIDDVKFFIIKVDSHIKQLLMLSYMIIYNYESTNKQLYCGIDFEFNSGRIALCQISFYPSKLFKYIFVFDPSKLSNEYTEIFVNMILISKIIKIMHGADSLDVPYIHEELLQNSDNFILFINTLIDTRYLCEYFKIYDKSENMKCSLYDALLYFDVIKKIKYDELNKNMNSMGKIYKINWNISTMDKKQLKYSIYDVVYLKKLYRKIVDDSIIKNENLHKQLKLIQEIDKLNYYERYNLSKFLDNNKSSVDKLNNYIIKNNDVNKTLNDIYEENIDNIKINNIKINNLLKINNFKKLLSLLFKYTFYSSLLNKNIVYKDKKTVFTKTIEIKYLINILEEFRLNKTIELINIIYNYT